MVICSHCGIEFNDKYWHNNRKYCSRKCMGLSRRGKCFDKSASERMKINNPMFNKELLKKRVKHTDYVAIGKKISGTRKRLFKEGKIKIPKMSDKNRKRVSDYMKVNNPMFNKDIINKVKESLKHVTIKPRTDIQKEHYSKSKIGEKNPNWNGGISYTKNYHGLRWISTRKKIYKRDNWTCQECGTKSKRIEAHHKIPYRLSKDNSDDNLVSLCSSCHNKQDQIFIRQQKRYIKIKSIEKVKHKTNVYNLSCEPNENYIANGLVVHNCSCSERDKKQELSLANIQELLIDAKNLGCKAVTITGGGEPLLHKDIKSILRLCSSLNFEVGLVTNGILLDKLTRNDYKSVVWVRVSFADHRIYDDMFEKSLKTARMVAPNVDFAFSYVLGKAPNYSNIYRIIKFANENIYTHIRIVHDLLDLDSLIDMSELKSKILSEKLDDSLVIYQGRKKFTPGVKKCWISLLKPVIDASGMITPCCGVQYKDKEPSKDFGKDSKDNMGSFRNLDDIIKKQKYYDGSQCYRCYYSDYNNVLDIMLNGLEHKNFV